MTDVSWGQIRGQLRESVGANNYAKWIEPLRFCALSEGVAQFAVPTSFLGTWVERNYGDRILGLLRGEGAPVTRLEFKVDVNAAAANSPAPACAAPAPAAAHSGEDDTLPGNALDTRFTFERFVVGKPNELAHAAAQRVAGGEAVAFNPLFLYGGSGLGKTHLMHAIGHELRRRRPELRVVYVSAEQFMYRFIQALRDRDTLEFKNLFRSVDVLMVDDVQFIAGKDSTQEEFFHTFNALIDQNKQIIISADRAPGEISKLESRIVGRLQSGLVVDLHPTTYELRLGILHQKAETYAAQFQGTEIDDGVLEFLAHRITSNVRVLEGALMRLFAFGSLVGHRITIEMTQECLADILRSCERKVTVEEIQRKVCDHYNIRLSDMIGPKRVRNYARPRQIAMFLSKQMTTRSLPEIGRRFGGRDHSTVIHAVKTIEGLSLKDSQMADDLELLKRALEE